MNNMTCDVVVPLTARKSRHTCDSCDIRHKGLCGAIPQEGVDKLNSIAWKRGFSAGTTIFGQNERMAYVGCVVSGVVKLVKTLSDGRQQIVGLALPSDFVGRPFRADSSCWAEAATEVRLCTFAKPQFEGLIGEVPEVEHWLLKTALDDLDAARERILLLGRKTAEQRVASLLLEFAERLAPSPAAGRICSFDLPLSRTEMADFLGLSLETVSRQVGKLRTRGVIAVRGTRRIDVLKPDALAAAACVQDASPPEKAAQ
jgi:CRP/FNR family transcriptional regulator